VVSVECEGTREKGMGGTGAGMGKDLWTGSGWRREGEGKRSGGESSGKVRKEKGGFGAEG
jgi:hypothetical protein